MKVYDELTARGLIAQVTDEEEIRNLVNEGKAVFYIGFDPTADSLHVGHFMALCLMKRLQMAGNKPIALIGGGTAMVGDPSGRTDMRQMMTNETIQHNVECFQKQMSRFIDFSDGKAMIVKLLSSPLIYLFCSSPAADLYSTVSFCWDFDKCRALGFSFKSAGLSPKVSTTAGPPKPAACSLYFSYPSCHASMRTCTSRLSSTRA